MYIEYEVLDTELQKTADYPCITRSLVFPVAKKYSTGTTSLSQGTRPIGPEKRVVAARSEVGRPLETLELIISSAGAPEFCNWQPRAG